MFYEKKKTFIKACEVREADWNIKIKAIRRNGKLGEINGKQI
jgi:hypothetical protein